MNTSKTPYRIALRAVAVWLLMMAVESLNGAVRELAITPLTGDLAGRAISFGVGIVLISALTLLTIRWIGAAGFPDLAGVGLLWALLTVFFEAFLIRPLAGISWERFLADYDPVRGGLMAFGILFLLVIPTIAYHVRTRRPAEKAFTP